ncbi:MAG TPA: amidase [Acidimicrobiales bacterium]
MDPFATALDIASAIRRREVSPSEVAESYLARIEALEPKLNAFSHRADDEVRTAAAKATALVASTDDPTTLAPFLGVPIPIKNLNAVAGWPLTYGSKGASRAPRQHSDPLVDRLLAAGFVLSGMTNTPEFGSISFTESDAHGITRNPWDPTRTPGGSSGGAAAAVASGMAPVAHASDGGGSIRIPAACCGLVGMKAGRARVPNGLIELEGFATNGAVARTVADASALFDVLAVFDPYSWYSAPQPAEPWSVLATRDPGHLRVGFTTKAPLGLPVDPACVAAVDKTVAALAAAGHEVTETSLEMPEQDTFVASFITVWNTGSAWSPVEDWDAIEPLNAALRNAARAVDSLTYAGDVRTVQSMAKGIIRPLVEDFDVLVTPTMSCLPPPVGAWREGIEADPTVGLLNCYPMAVFTSIFNVTGLPAISVPVHHDEASGLPVGAQVVAGPWRDDLCFQVAAQLEQALPWADRHPTLP